MSCCKGRAKGAKKSPILSLNLQWARPRKPTASERESYGLPPVKPLAAQAAVLLKRYDTNDDGSLGRAEFHAFVAEALPKHASAAEALLEACDKDGDGSVGINEMRAFLRVYDPDAPIDVPQSVPRKSALIIVDVQNDFITGTLANQFQAEAIVPVINGMRDAFDLVVISLDWHPHQHCSFVETANAGEPACGIKDSKGAPAVAYNPFESVKLREDADRPAHTQVLYPRHGVQGSWGSHCHERLDVRPDDPRIHKGTKPNIDSYSAFFDNCKANDTGLTALLEAQGVTDVFVCGLVFDICVKATAVHGAEMGFSVSVIEDACRPLDPNNNTDVKAELAAAGVAVISAGEAAHFARAGRGQAKPLREVLSAAHQSRGAHTVLANLEGEGGATTMSMVPPPPPGN